MKRVSNHSQMILSILIYLIISVSGSGQTKQDLSIKQATDSKYKISRYVIGNGCVAGAGNSKYIHLATAGEPVIGIVENSNNSIFIGFWSEGFTASTINCNTFVGTDVWVDLGDEAYINFATVTTAGNTWKSNSFTPPDYPENMTPVQPYYDIQTTASYSGNIHVELPYNPSGLTTEIEQALRLYLYDQSKSQWVDVTDHVNTSEKNIRGDVDKLSYFLIMYQNSATEIDAITDNSIQRFTLHQNYPNPFNTETIISYDLTARSFVNIDIYNVNGQMISKLLAENQNSGFRSIVWDGHDGSGKQVSPGIYFCQLTISDENKKNILFHAVSKILLIK